MLNDLLIFAKIREGDIKTFEKVFRLYYAPLCMYASCIVRRYEDAEEIVQELFYVLWRDREKLQLQHSLKSYLYGAVHKQSLQYLAHEEVKQRYEEMVIDKNPDATEADAEQHLAYEELQRVIDETLKRLPQRCAEIFKMHRQQKKKYEEIASTFQLSVKTVEAEMSKALKALRENVEQYFK